jgi:hypothetical protein
LKYPLKWRVPAKQALTTVKFNKYSELQARMELTGKTTYLDFSRPAVALTNDT